MICTNADLEEELKNQLFEEITEDDHLLWNRGKRYKLLPSIIDNLLTSSGEQGIFTLFIYCVSWLCG